MLKLMLELKTIMQSSIGRTSEPDDSLFHVETMKCIEDVAKCEDDLQDLEKRKLLVCVKVCILKKYLI